MFVDYDSFSYEKFDDFLDDLKPQKRLYNILGDYIFRGQSEDWPLLPSIFRPENKSRISKYSIYSDFSGDEIDYRYVEYYLLIEFYKNINLLGIKLPDLLLPDYDYIMAENPINKVKLLDIKWLPDNLTEIAALAQHYGIMTRLIDWSFDINISLYFAAKGVINSVIENDCFSSDKIVIWALPYKPIAIATSIKNCKFSNPEETKKIPPLKFVIPSYYNNPNIAAQKGILTYWETHSKTVEANIEPLDKLLKKWEWPEPKVFRSSLYKITIPSSESFKILAYLSRINYNAATVFPGYDGAAKKIFEEDNIAYAQFLLNERKTLKKTVCLDEYEQRMINSFKNLSKEDKLLILGKIEQLILNRRESKEIAL